MKNKTNKLVLLSATLLFVLASCRKDNMTNGNQDPLHQKDQLYTVQEINAAIQSSLQKNGRFNWQEQSDELLFSAIMHGDSLLSVGYGNPQTNSITNTESFNSEPQMTNISLSEARRAGVNIDGIKTEILQQVRNDEGIKANAVTTESYQDVLQYESPVLTSMVIKISKLSTLQDLRKSKAIRYVEPAEYNKNLLKSRTAIATESLSSGGGDPTELPGWFIQGSGEPLIPKSYADQKIPEAWKISTGKGITIGLIDNGIYQSQTAFSAQEFNSSGTGRTIALFGTFKGKSSSNDGVYATTDDMSIGHGTGMATLISAPKKASLPVGIAYNCNLVSYRGTDFVALWSSKQQQGVASALTKLADNDQVKIISMSNGWIFDVSVLADAVKYAKSKGKLIFAAAGTSIKPIDLGLFVIDIPKSVGVIFPASMSETVAVTGTDYNETGKLVSCKECHEGDKVYFTTTTATAAGVNNAVPVYQDTPGKYGFSGSSSAATAINAGIAALVWSSHPSWNAKQVLQRMVESAKLYPNKDSKLGYGPINVLKAVQP
ncbi:S8/S53 family peptidase [Pedobacter sp. PAMC26386]|nr:S8/S53 family peptidase [Pedobacter sp. PAMC26386]